MLVRNLARGCALYILLFYAVTLSAHAESVPQDCPDKIAVVSESVMAGVSQEILRQVYLELGCEITLETYPGLRAIAWFNNGSVDGEMYRLEVAEKRYTRDFIRSSLPLFNVNGSLWVHPDPSLVTGLPIGFVQGIVWEENYMEGRRGKKFDTVEDAFAAYERGVIGSFLSSDFAVVHKIAQSRFSADPVREEMIVVAPLYHYLGAEFSPFMKRFSDYLEKYAPFSALEFSSSEAAQK